METLDVVLGAAIAGLAWLAGRTTKRGPKPYVEPPAICGCGHHWSYHGPANDDDVASSGACHHVHYRMGDPYPCTCKKYSGPLPLHNL